ncbi:MAG: PAS domain-containing protein [Nitrospina sp.]|jgi:PAS domain S-box-containing protein|nr:PAS domain-containing protein [Nitrospina sp.]MBT5631658.1 PAS domain-containing protein [Nitrospina sp.]
MKENPHNFIARNFLFLDMMPVGTFIIDQNYWVHNWNSCLERWSGISKETILGTSLLEHFPRLKQPQYSLRINEIFKGGPPVIFSSKFHQYLIPCPIGKGRYQTQQTMVTPVHDEKVQNHYALFTIQDVTDATHQLAKFRTIKENLLKKEIDLGNLLLEVKRINIELEQFAQVVSHDLKAPLRSIQNLTNWILDNLEDKVAEDSKAHLHLMKEQVIRMQTMIDAILEYSKDIGGEHKMELVNTQTLIKEIIEEAHAPASFRFHIHPDLPKFYTHRTKLKQVFSNLVNNAVKHHDRQDGEVEIGVNDKGETFEFRVKDDGPGIDPTYQKNIFIIFQTASKKLSENSTGIGLAIVKKIVTDNKGTVELVSSLGEGSQFTFTWPKNLQTLNNPNP